MKKIFGIAVLIIALGTQCAYAKDLQGIEKLRFGMSPIDVLTTIPMAQLNKNAAFEDELYDGVIIPIYAKESIFKMKY